MSGSGDDVHEEDGFLARWSRRKRAADVETEETEAAPAAPGEPVEDLDALSDEELLERFNLPEPTTLKPGDDFSVFMQRGVPARLRSRALRLLWGTNPTLANLDELLDYGEDFTDAATVVENLTTLYQVGRGIAVPEPEEPIVEAETASEADDAPSNDAPQQDVASEEDAVDEALIEADPPSETPPISSPLTVERPRAFMTFEFNSDEKSRG